MKNFSHWGWTLVLLGVFFITAIGTTIYYLGLYGADMGLFFIGRYYIFPVFLELGIAALVALLVMLVAKNLFKNPTDAFFLPLNCILLATVFTRIVHPIMDFMFTMIEELGNFNIY